MEEYLCRMVKKHEDAMKKKDFHAALSAADAIRNVGLHLGSDAWNAAMEINKRIKNDTPKKRRDGEVRNT